jgi:hypothetical protein
MYEFFDRLVAVALPRVRDFRGRWGLDTRDRFGGESAPTGPKHERNGIDRVRWEDPLSWAGMQKVDPDPAAAARAVHARRADVVARIAEIDTDVARERTDARSETVAARAMTGDSATSALADTRRAAVEAREERISNLRAERRALEAEMDALQMAEAKGLPPEGPRAHLGEEVPVRPRLKPCCVPPTGTPRPGWLKPILSEPRICGTVVKCSGSWSLARSTLRSNWVLAACSTARL